jgi:hypothetical protein
MGDISAAIEGAERKEGAIATRLIDHAGKGKGRLAGQAGPAV